MRSTKVRLGIAALAVLAVGVPAAAAGGLFFQGAKGVGDPYYPKMGNTGYDVESYAVDLKYRRSGVVKSETTIDAEADTDQGAAPPGPALSEFHLDFRGPTITRLEVNGLETSYTRRGKQEVVIQPDVPIGDGVPFTVAIRYKGRPKQVKNPDGSRDGWTETGDGAVALGEPQQTPSWIPVNDHPTDKASWSFRYETPRDLMAISTGLLVNKERTETKTITEWEQQEPMASYLAMAAIGEFKVDKDPIGALPYLGAVDRDLGKAALDSLREKTEVAHTFLETVAGPYPFAVTGGVVDPAEGLGFAMETQTRSYYPGPPNQQLVIHEVAHQWYGNSVSVDSWKEIWLNEGFATYMEWLYQEEHGGESVADRFARIYNAKGPASSFWNPPPANPGGPENLFAWSVYDRGAMALQVLRQEIGGEDFFHVLEAWAQNDEYGNASTQDLYELIEAVTHDPRPDRFDEWLYEPGKPSCPTC